MCFCAAKRITDHIKDDALPSGTTHPTADRHDYLPGNPLKLQLLLAIRKPHRLDIQAAILLERLLHTAQQTHLLTGRERGEGTFGVGGQAQGHRRLAIFDIDAVVGNGKIRRVAIFQDLGHNGLSGSLTRHR
jgi:hypothetical protein